MLASSKALPLVEILEFGSRHPAGLKSAGILAAGLLWTTLSVAIGADDVDRAIHAIHQVGPEAAGSVEARQAREELARQGPEIMPRLLVAMDTNNLVAANWLRTAFDTIADRELARAHNTIPRPALESFVRDPQRNGRARRLGLTVLERLEPTIRQRWLPGWLDDPEFRRDAVSHVLQLGDQAKRDADAGSARGLYERGFRHARDSDQVLLAVARLKSVGSEVDPVAHMGFVVRWWLVGPFPAEQTSGFRATFPPEKQVDVAAEYELVDGTKLRWIRHETTNSLGEVNLIQAIGPAREAVGYAFAEVESPREQPAQLRCSADDNLIVWLNDRQVLAREQWLNGTRLDRFVTPVTLQPGLNRILVKICQGPQHVNPEVPNNWSFQLRFCDPTGGGIDVRNVPDGRSTGRKFE